MHERFGTDGDGTLATTIHRVHIIIDHHDARCDARWRTPGTCRRYQPIPQAVVIDKGTLDALSGDSHKLAMLRECARMCDFDNGGIILSVSFAAAARVGLLARATARLGLDSKRHGCHAGGG
jgi:hypothetical protein